MIFFPIGFSNFSSSPLVLHSEPLFAEKGVRLYIKRDDLLCPQEPSGNKWRKLAYNLFEMNAQKKKRVLTFGGAYSNHLAAVAAAGKQYDFETIGVVRGETTDASNATLLTAEHNGMQLHFVDRQQYSKKYHANFLDSLRDQYGDFYLLPEGGTNRFAMKGASEIVAETRRQLGYAPDFFCLPAGTGGTAAGMIGALEKGQKVVAISVLKGDFMWSEIERLLCEFRPGASYAGQYVVQNNYHFGGYAKWTLPLIHFIEEMRDLHGLPLDPVYTGKSFYAVWDLARKDFFPRGSTVVALHTGGLQGLAGFRERFHLL